MPKEGTNDKIVLLEGRLPIVEKCRGWEEVVDDKGKVTKPGAQDCSKIFQDDDGVEKCMSYRDPKAIQRRGCALGDNHPITTKKDGMTLKRKFGKKRRNR